MKNSLIKTLLITSFLISSSVAIAGSNNGYTSAANVYSGSSSRTWFGAGVAHVLAEWKKERSAPEKVEQPSPTSEEPAKSTDSTPS